MMGIGSRRRRERERRERGANVIRVLDAIALASEDGRLPRVPTLRAVAKSHGLPDPYPPHHPTDERPLT